MKTLTMVMGFFLFLTTANAQLGLPKSATTDLKCNVYRSIARLPNGLLVYPCSSSQKEPMGIAFVSISMNLSKAAELGSKLELQLRCTNGSPNGVFAYGGETIGFESSRTQNQKYFYAIGENNYGRCYFNSDAALLKNFQLVQNKSGILLVPVSALKGNAEIAL